MRRVEILCSISFAETSVECVNFTKAPPSLSLGRISVILMGSLSVGTARLTILRGWEEAPKLEFSKRFIKPSRSDSKFCHGARSKPDNFKGKILSSHIMDSLEAALIWPSLSTLAVIVVAVFCQALDTLAAAGMYGV